MRRLEKRKPKEEIVVRIDTEARREDAGHAITRALV